MTALPSAQASAPQPPDLQLHLIGDSDGNVDQCCGAGSRRPSNVSLSRIRSCPQLAALRNRDQDSPYSDMAPITDEQGNIIHMYPVLKHNLCVDVGAPDTGGIRSAASTPTPPSTPGSRRNHVITSSCISKSQTHNSAAVPPFAPTLQNQSKTHSMLENTNHAVDSQTRHLDGWVPVGNENLQRYDQCYFRNSGSSVNFPFGDFSGQIMDDENASDAGDGSSVHINGRFPSQGDYHCCHNYLQDVSGDDSIGKCSRWLQSLQINTADRVKSRSHIQLPTA